MMPHRHALSALACLLFVAALGYWHRAPSYRTELPELVSASSSCDRDYLLQTSRLTPEQLPKGIGSTVILRGGTILKPSPESPHRLAVELSPLERVTVLAEIEERRHLFVRIDRAGVCGWLPRDDLLLVNTAPASAIFDGPRPLPANAAGIIGPIGFPRRITLQSRESQEVPIMLTPGGRGTGVRPPIGPAPVLHVFAEVANKSSRHLLVGVRREETEIYGWVDAADTRPLPSALWETQEPKLVFELATLDILVSIADTACTSLGRRNPDTSVIEQATKRLLGDELVAAQASPGALLRDVFAIPAARVPVLLNESWPQLQDRWRHALEPERRSVAMRSCDILSALVSARADGRVRAHADADTVPLGWLPANLLH